MSLCAPDEVPYENVAIVTCRQHDTGIIWMWLQHKHLRLVTLGGMKHVTVPQQQSPPASVSTDSFFFNSDDPNGPCSNQMILNVPSKIFKLLKTYKLFFYYFILLFKNIYIY